MMCLMITLYYWTDLKKTIAKIRKRATFQKQPLDNKPLRFYFFKLIFIANNAHTYIKHVIYLLFMLSLRMTAYHMWSVLLFLTLARIALGSLQHLRWSSLEVITCCLVAITRQILGQCLRGRLTSPILITALFIILVTDHKQPHNKVKSLSPIEHLWGLTWNPPYIIAMP